MGSEKLGKFIGQATGYCVGMFIAFGTLALFGMHVPQWVIWFTAFFLAVTE